MATLNSRKVLNHLLVNALDVDPTDIKAISKSGAKYYQKLITFTVEDIQQLRKDGDITMSCCRDLTDFKLYVDATNPSKDFIMAMTSDSWDLVDVTMLRLKKITRVNGHCGFQTDANYRYRYSFST